MGDDEVIIPVEYQQYVFKALEITKICFVATGRGIVSALQWSVVIAIGFTLGLITFLALQAVVRLLLLKQLKKRKLYFDFTHPKQTLKAKTGSMRTSNTGVPIFSLRSITAAAGTAGPLPQLPTAAAATGGAESKR